VFEEMNIDEARNDRKKKFEWRRKKRCACDREREKNKSWKGSLRESDETTVD
jgi:hypothetical protein